jgi:sulfide dehydrogenase [flavocytochrome c] flavoprotein chain
MTSNSRRPVPSKPTVRRRTFNALLLASIGVSIAPSLLAGSKVRVVIIGGGAAGASAAQILAGTGKIDVVLVEANGRYTTPFFTNRALANLQPLESFTFGYDKLAAHDNIRVIHDRVIGGDPVKRTVRLADGGNLPYDRLIVAPGTSLLTEQIEGYGPKTAEMFPHAYNGSSATQWTLLIRQIQTMDDGGLVVITAPERPYKCTPAPYERASLIGGYLHKHKPKSKVLILDAKVEFPLMDAMLEVWEAKFGDLIEWVSADFGGAITAVNNKTRTIITDDEPFSPAVGNIIPPQRAGSIAKILNLADDSGWCPVNPLTFESTRQQNIHVLGDAIDAGDMPKSAAAAYQQALSASTAITNLLTGSSRPIPKLENACYFLTEPGQALVVGGRYRATKDRIIGTEGYSSDPGESVATRQDTARQADQWYRDLTKAMFG